MRRLQNRSIPVMVAIAAASMTIPTWRVMADARAAAPSLGARSRRRQRRGRRFVQPRDRYSCNPGMVKSNSLCGALRQIDSAAVNVRPAIVDPHHHGTARVEIRYAHARAQRQATGSCGYIVAMVNLAA